MPSGHPGSALSFFLAADLRFLSAFAQGRCFLRPEPGRFTRRPEAGNERNQLADDDQSAKTEKDVNGKKTGVFTPLCRGNRGSGYGDEQGGKSDDA